MKTDLARFVREWREKAGYNQPGLAKILKYTTQQVSNVERGVHTRPVYFCKRLVKFMNKTDAKKLNNLLVGELLTKIDGLFK